MDKGGIVVVYLQDIEYHFPYEFGKGGNLAEEGTCAKRGGDGDKNGGNQYGEQRPP